MSLDPATIPISYHAYERAAERFGIDQSDDEWLLTADWVIRDKLKRVRNQNPKLKAHVGRHATACRTYKTGAYSFVVSEDGTLVTVLKGTGKKPRDRR